MQGLESSPGGGTPSNPRRRKRRALWGLWLASFAVVLIVIVASIGLWYRPGANPEPPVMPSPEELEVLSRGEVYVELPLMTYYSPTPPDPNASVSMRVSFSAGCPVNFSWDLPMWAGLPVHFVANDTYGHPFEAGDDGGFIAHIGRKTNHSSESYSGTLDGPVRAAIFYMEAVINYTVRRMALANETWFEVDYYLRAPQLVSISMPRVNVTMPGPGDLVEALRETVDVWPANDHRTSLNDMPPFPGRFRHTVGAILLDGGRLGPLAPWLSSHFQWQPEDHYVVTVESTARATWTWTWYWDARFGSFLVA